MYFETGKDVLFNVPKNSWGPEKSPGSKIKIYSDVNIKVFAWWDVCFCKYVPSFPKNLLILSSAPNPKMESEDSSKVRHLSILASKTQWHNLNVHGRKDSKSYQFETKFYPSSMKILQAFYVKIKMKVIKNACAMYLQLIQQHETRKSLVFTTF
jgi:hypothetical protein